ncbi:hypothetical protein [Roseomonas gilardii]|uniref:hypothetical protein n=1 Tax=Roseomonas gilardii TaxID=257708 RepID=UPI001B7FB5BE|nr:hypothetical protein [Roseomonas gilardii]
MSLHPPVRYTPAVEEIQPDEQDTIRGLNDAFDTILETTAKDYGHAVRSVHAKAHGILEGRMVPGCNESPAAPPAPADIAAERGCRGIIRCAALRSGGYPAVTGARNGPPCRLRPVGLRLARRLSNVAPGSTVGCAWSTRQEATPGRHTWRQALQSWTAST